MWISAVAVTGLAYFGMDLVDSYRAYNRNREMMLGEDLRPQFMFTDIGDVDGNGQDDYLISTFSGPLLFMGQEEGYAIPLDMAKNSFSEDARTKVESWLEKIEFRSSRESVN